jgi:hypothetical protein
MTSHAEAGNMANANCQTNIPAHAIPSSDFDLVHATAPILLFNYSKFGFANAVHKCK